MLYFLLISAKKYQELHGAAGGDNKKKDKKPAKAPEPKKEKAAPAPKVKVFLDTITIGFT